MGGGVGGVGELYALKNRKIKKEKPDWILVSVAHQSTKKKIVFQKKIIEKFKTK